MIFHERARRGRCRLTSSWDPISVFTISRYLLEKVVGREQPRHLPWAAGFRLSRLNFILFKKSTIEPTRARKATYRVASPLEPYKDLNNFECATVVYRPQWHARLSINGNTTMRFPNDGVPSLSISILIREQKYSYFVKPHALITQKANYKIRKIKL